MEVRGEGRQYALQPPQGFHPRGASTPLETGSFGILLSVPLPLKRCLYSQTQCHSLRKEKIFGALLSFRITCRIVLMQTEGPSSFKEEDIFSFDERNIVLILLKCFSPLGLSVQLWIINLLLLSTRHVSASMLCFDAEVLVPLIDQLLSGRVESFNSYGGVRM